MCTYCAPGCSMPTAEKAAFAILITAAMLTYRLLNKTIPVDC